MAVILERRKTQEYSAMIPSGFCHGSLFYQRSWSPSTAAVYLSRESKYWIIGYWWSRNLQDRFLKRKNCLGEGNLCGVSLYVLNQGLGYSCQEFNSGRYWKDHLLQSWQMNEEVARAMQCGGIRFMAQQEERGLSKSLGEIQERTAFETNTTG